MIKPDISTAVFCYHCGDQCNTDIHENDKFFCCNGCRSVYHLLHQSGLCDYYSLNDHPGTSQAQTSRKDKFAYLDNEEIQQKLVTYRDAAEVRAVFYMPQVHCSSCLWLLENLHSLNPGILHTTVRFAEKEIYIVFDPGKLSLREVVELLDRIGYEPHISLDDNSPKTPAKIERSKIYKVGLAGFCFANIMLMSFPEYFSVKGVEAFKYGMIFRYMNLILALPVLFYSANEFFITAWKGLKNKYLNIDFPVSVAIVITFLRSVYEIFTNTGPGYLDSMTGIVFFMLVGRIFQEKTYRFLSFDRDYQSFFPIAVTLVKDGKTEPTRLQDLRKDDIIRIYESEMIPCDAILSKGRGMIDYSFVTGESLPQMRHPGELIYAGGKQKGSMIELVVVKEVSQSYLTGLWNRDAAAKKNISRQPSDYVDFIGKYFTLAVLAIAGISAVYWASREAYMTMLDVITTVLIVACPCALLLSASFTHGNILRFFSSNKLYLRDASVINAMATVTHLVFDKTGTLTENQPVQVSWEGAQLDENIKSYLASLMMQSTHPLSKAIIAYLSVSETQPVENYLHHPGMGIEGWVEERHIQAGSPAFAGRKESVSDGSVVCVSLDGNYQGRFFVHQQYRYGMADEIRSLKREYEISVISGDNDSQQQRLSALFGPHTELRFNQSPLHKLNYIANLQEEHHAKVMMIGDGLNDAHALLKADVGLAVTENTNNFTPACDGILRASRLAYLGNFLRFAKSSKRIVLVTFVVSAIYNIVGLRYAVMGELKPVIAAILMPASTISIILLTYVLTAFYAWKCGLKKS